MAPTAREDEFIEHLLDLMRDLGAVSARRMFGGHGIYRGSVMFGLVASNVLYLKADAVNRPLFEAESLEPFTYEGKGKPVQMSYFRAPDQALESPAIMSEWATHAYEAALRSGTRSKKKTAKKSARKITKKAAGAAAKKKAKPATGKTASKKAGGKKISKAGSRKPVPAAKKKTQSRTSAGKKSTGKPGRKTAKKA